MHHATSAGTKKWIAVKGHREIGEAASHLRRDGFSILAVHPSATAVDYRAADYKRPTALVLGAELHGLSPEALS